VWNKKNRDFAVVTLSSRHGFNRLTMQNIWQF